MNIPMRNLVTVLSIALCAASCNILPKREPIRVFVPVHSAGTVSGPKVSWSLLVAKPAASDWLDSERIAVRPGTGNVQVYKGASWSDPVPELVQTALLHGFEDSQKILTVGRPGAGVKGRFQLLTEVRAFETDYASGNPMAVLDLQAKLVDGHDGAVVASHNFRNTESAGAGDVDAVVAAMSHVLDATTTQVVGWSLSEGENHERVHPGEK